MLISSPIQDELSEGYLGESTTCPLCAEESSKPSWLGSTRYQGKEFPYVTCGGCRSLYCRPMPNAADLESMYGTSYRSSSGLETISDPAKPAWVLAWLDRLSTGTFIDYGCGSGELLVAAKQRGWDVLGVELGKDVADDTTTRTGLPVVTVDEALDKGRFADVLHVGDVLEHLTDLDREMTRILSLIERGGFLLAQGPRRMGICSTGPFAWLALSVIRSAADMPLLPCSRHRGGQWALFRRSGLETPSRRA